MILTKHTTYERKERFTSYSWQCLHCFASFFFLRCGYAKGKPLLKSKAQFRAPDLTQLNSTQLVELSRVGRSELGYNSTQLNSTQLKMFRTGKKLADQLSWVESGCSPIQSARPDSTQLVELSWVESGRALWIGLYWHVCITCSVDSWLSDLLRKWTKNETVGSRWGHVPQCPIAGDATDPQWLGVRPVMVLPII